MLNKSNYWLTTLKATSTQSLHSITRQPFQAVVVKYLVQGSQTVLPEEEVCEWELVFWV